MHPSYTKGCAQSAEVTKLRMVTYANVSYADWR